MLWFHRHSVNYICDKKLFEAYRLFDESKMTLCSAEYDRLGPQGRFKPDLWLLLRRVEYLKIIGGDENDGFEGL